MIDPVLVIGAGPTGLTAALELSRFGIKVRLIDKRDAPATTSRAIGVQARTLELFEQRGLAGEMVRLGNEGRFGSVYSGGERVFRLDFAHIESPYPYILFISQAETERVLRDALMRHGIEPEWRTELVAIQQDALSRDQSPAHAVLKRADGAMEHVATPWLIGAEGAHSLVRTTLDLPYEGHTREEQYALGDLRIEGGLTDTDFHIFSSDHGFLGLFPMGGEHFRLIASNPLSEPSPASAPSQDELQKIFDQRSPIRARFHDMTWSSWFRINSRMVPRLKIGRLFLGGDSAHIHSPAGAQGMNTGIQDMINLCWKLARVVTQKAPEALLDTYESDRLPVMRNVLQRTDALTTTIGSENKVARMLFNHLGPFVGGADFVQENATANMSQIAVSYRDSELSERHRGGGSLHAGDRIPTIVVRRRENGAWTETSLLSALDPSHFTLLVAAQNGDGIPDSLRAAGFDGRVIEIAPTNEPNGAKRFAEIFGRHSCMVLVRPDGYAGLTSPLDLAANRIASYQTKWLSAPKASH